MTTNKIIPRFAVIDRTDGYTWTKDRKGKPFLTSTSARAFADQRNRVYGTMDDGSKVFVVASLIVLDSLDS